MQLTLTPLELSSLSEAIRYNQQAIAENSGHLDPTLSRIQRKIGEQPHD